MGAVLCAWAVVVLEAAVPRYACSGWSGPDNGHGGKEETRERSWAGRYTQPDGHKTFSGGAPKGRHFEGTPGGVEKVSSEEYFMAASSLVRWSGSAALLGGLSTVFVDEVMLFHQSKSKGE
jgi:hypothetical protein